MFPNPDPIQIVGSNDFEYRLKLLKRINAIRIHGKPLSHLKILGRYNVWHCFQHQIFYVDLHAFVDGNQPSERAGFSTEVKRIIILWAVRMLSKGGKFSLWLRRPSVLVYSVDNINSKFSRSDARMDPAYRAVSKSHLRFIEAFHTIPGLSTVRNALVRGRLSLYDAALGRGGVAMPVLDWADVDLSNFSEKERLAVKKIVERYYNLIPKFEARVREYESVLRASSVRVVLAIDDTRNYYHTVLGAKLAGIPVYAVQHGRFGKYHLGWLTDGTFDGEIIRPETLYVWSGYWRDELLRLGTYFAPEEIKVGGLKSAPIPPVARQAREWITVVIPYETEAAKDEVRRYIDAFLKCDNVRVLFSLRSDMDKRRQLYEYGLDERYHSHFSVTDDQKKAAAEADIVAGTCSTYLYDMVAHERPVIVLQTSVRHLGEALIRNGLAEEMTLGDSFNETVRMIYQTPQSILGIRRRLLFGDTGVLMEDTLQGILPSAS